jgi:hypothetical protein
MIKRVTLALTFVTALAVAGFGISSTADAGCGYGGGYGGGYRGGYGGGYGAHYVPAVSVGYRYAAPVVQPAYYAPPVRSYHAYPTAYPSRGHHHHHHSGFRLSIGF